MTRRFRNWGNRSARELNLKNIIEFLGEHGVDAETSHMVESQCTGDTEGRKDAEPGEKAMITFLESWKFVLFSTTFLTPIAEIIP